MALAPGFRLGRYEILAPLGAGGMGEVYRARDGRLGREVAVKVLPEAAAEDPESLARFEREARAVAALPHPNIVAIHDVGHEGRVSYAVLELLEGHTLRETLEKGPIPWRRALEIAVPVAEALAAAHVRGIVHRDLKPENIFLTTVGRPKILDFGLVRHVAPELSDDTAAATQGPMTQPGIVMGTLSYLSPEQARGERVDGRSDLFALGAVLYEMLTGRRAFSAPTPSDTLVAILRDEPRPPSTLGIRLPAELEEVLRRCLEKNVERRFPSASDLAFALSSIAREEGRSLAGAAAPATAMSVAVLPFLNMSADRENEYFSDGMTEELINALAQVPGLRVAARTSSFAFKEKREDVRVIGERLGVGAVLEGSVRRAGERLRVTAQLVNTADGYQVWSENYDRDARDVFAVQEEIARAIVGQLRVRLGLGGETIVKRYTSDPEAYNLYLRGRYFWNRRSPESMRRATAYFEAAIARDPGYAEAYAGLADCYINRPHKDMAKGRDAAARAVSLGPDLAEAHAALARAIFSFDWDWDGAEREFRKAIALNPAYAETYHAYSHYLVPAGRSEESLAASRRALELDPLSVSMVAHLGWHYLYSGQPAEAERYSRAALEMDADFFPARMHLGIELETAGRYAEAIAEFERARDASPGTSEALGGLGHALAAAGRREEAEAVRGAIEDIARTGYASPYDRALIDAGLGNREAAIGWLEKAAEERTPQIVELCVDPRFANLGAEPRRAELCRRVGLKR